MTIIECPRCGIPHDKDGNAVSAADEHGACLLCRGQLIGDPVKMEPKSFGKPPEITTPNLRVLTGLRPALSR